MTSPRSPLTTDVTEVLEVSQVSHVSDVTVVVPAHNEEELIGSCLEALSVAVRMVRPTPVHVIVVLDDCTDGTAAALEAVTALRLEVVEVALRRVGAVRAAGFIDAPRTSRSWYATTDADSRVPSNWLATQLRLAMTHDVVVGTVDVTDWTPRRQSLKAVYETSYRFEGEHRHVHATNLGVRAHTYWAAGGFGPATVHEDRDLVQRCDNAGARIAWSAEAPVTTSARHSDRTPWGFSAHLGQLESELPA